MDRKILFEVCANGLQSALNAQEAGADRIELCEHLELGGLTPQPEVISSVREKLSIPIKVLIRPRAGDFFYSEEEFERMRHDVEACSKLKVEGVVFGILKRDFSVDIPRCTELTRLAKNMSVTFHRAFDMVKDPFQSFGEIISLGCNFLLTSGQKENCLEGSDLISQLVKQSVGKIAVMAGGGITEENIEELVRRTGANEFHFSAKVKSENGEWVSDVNRIRKIKEIAEKVFYAH